jgi:hypothetical protein
MSEFRVLIGNKFVTTKLFLAVIPALLLLSALSNTGFAQVFPNFPAPINNPSITAEQGVSAASVPNAVYGTVLMSVYIDPSSGQLGFAISPDGQNYVYNSHVTNLPLGDCNATRPSTCSAAVVTFQGIIYVAYSDFGDSYLNVAVATPIQNNVSYTWALVHTDSSVALNTSPAMAASPDGQTLDIIFGSRTNPNVKNAYYEVTLNSGNWTTANQSHLGSNGIASASQPGLAVLGGQSFLALQQNGGTPYLWLASSPDGFTWGPAHMVSSSLALKTGASMVTYNGSLVMAVEQDGSTQDLYIFSSPNGVNWSAQAYPSIILGSTPGLGLFNGGISLSYRSNNSGNSINASFTTN